MPDRRRFLGTGAALALGLLSGCTPPDPRAGTPGPGGARPSPTPESSSPTSPTPSPAGSPPPTSHAAATAATREQRLAGRAAAVLDQHGDALSRRQRAGLAGVRDTHLSHAAALRGPEPTSRATAGASAAPLPPAGRAGLRRALRGLRAAERAAGRSHRTAAVATTGFEALLLASLGVAAARFAVVAEQLLDDAEPDPIAAAATPLGLPARPAIAAVQDVVGQLHAIVYGYQLALGQLTVRSQGHGRALARLREHRELRDGLIQQLIDASADVPVAEPAYVPSVRPRSPGTAARLLAAMETALAPHLGLWLAAAGGADRSRAYQALDRTVAAAVGWGAAIPRWPGWPR
jgi:hypothetical protein